MANHLGSGGNSRVFSATSADPDLRQQLDSIALKIYDDEVDFDIEDYIYLCRSTRLDEISSYLLAAHDKSSTHYPTVGAPLFVVESIDGAVVGAALVRVDSVRFRRIGDFYRSRDRNELRVALNAAIQLTRLVSEIHQRGFIIGDLSHTNVLIDRDGYVTLLDADAYGRVAPPRRARGATANWTAPEVAMDGTPTQASDRFLVAVHVAKLLLRGVGPFDCRDPEYPDKSVQTHINEGNSWLWNPKLRALGKVSSGGFKELPNGISTELQRLLQGNPDFRPETVERLLDLLTDQYESVASYGKFDCHIEEASDMTDVQGSKAVGLVENPPLRLTDRERRREPNSKRSRRILQWVIFVTVLVALVLAFTTWVV